LWWPVRHLSVS